MSWLNITTGENETKGSVGFNNTTGIDGPKGDKQYKEPTGLHILRLVLFSLIILAGIIGNSVICKAVWSTPQFQKPFSYYLVANMAFAEILSNLCSAFMLADWEFNFSNVILSNIACVLNPLQVLSLMVVTYSMATIAFYRYRVLINSFSKAPPRKAKTMIIACLWLMPAAICVPTFLGFKLEHGKCALQPVLFNKTHVITRFVLNFAVPYFAILVSYGAVAMSLRKRIAVKRAAQEKSSINSSTFVVEIEGPIELQNGQREGNCRERQLDVLNVTSNRRYSKPENTDLEKDLLKMIYAIILIVMICYFPYQAVFLWEKIVETDSWQFYYHLLLQKYVFLLTCLPSALHPLCYGTMNWFYANAFSIIFLCKKT